MNRGLLALRFRPPGASMPADAGKSGAIAQLGERLNGIQEVGGSRPPGSTRIPQEPRTAQALRGFSCLPASQAGGQSCPPYRAAPRCPVGRT